MKFIVMTNWDNKFLDGLDPRSIEYVCGRLPRDPVGSASILPQNMAKRINKKGLKSYIKCIHAKKMKFNYMFDGHCTGNKEYSWYGNREILDMLKWISDSGADAITVVLPHLVQIIRKDFPHLKVGYGGMRVIWEMTRVKYYDAQGISFLMLNSATNRNFRLLRALRNAVKCDLWLTLNSSCLLFCNFGFDHDNFLSHTSNHTAPEIVSEYFHANCFSEFLKRPFELIRAPWIRPQDLKYYQDVGYDKFVIYPNSSDTEDYLRTINAYKNKSYDGNLLDLLSLMGKKIFDIKNCRNSKNVVSVDTKKLDGFLNYFVSLKKDCSAVFCDECKYCEKSAKGVISLAGKSQIKEILQRYKTTIERIEDGKAF